VLNLVLLFMLFRRDWVLVFFIWKTFTILCGAVLVAVEVGGSSAEAGGAAGGLLLGAPCAGLRGRNADGLVGGWVGGRVCVKVGARAGVWVGGWVKGGGFCSVGRSAARPLLPRPALSCLLHVRSAACLRLLHLALLVIDPPAACRLTVRRAQPTRPRPPAAAPCPASTQPAPPRLTPPPRATR
jgi:hypothetical protein